MTVHRTPHDDLVAQIDTVSADRNPAQQQGEIERINDLAEELNHEAIDVLDYQTLS